MTPIEIFFLIFGVKQLNKDILNYSPQVSCFVGHPVRKDINEAYSSFFPRKSFHFIFFLGGGGEKLEVPGKINVLIKRLYSIYI